LSVTNEEVVVDGMLDELMAQSIFMNVTGGHPSVSMQYGYNQTENRTTIHFIPYRVYAVDMTPEVKKHVKKDISFERKIVIPGNIGDSAMIANKYWMPARRRAKRNSDDLKWVVVTSRILKDAKHNTEITEISFYIEVYDERSHDPRGCKDCNVEATLNRATDLMIRELCKIILSEKGELHEANLVRNQISMEFVEALATALSGNTPENP
jgi:hypothetical protein